MNNCHLVVTFFLSILTQGPLLSVLHLFNASLLDIIDKNEEELLAICFKLLLYITVKSFLFVGLYCALDIIVFFVGRTIHEIKTPTKCWFNFKLKVVCLVWISMKSSVHEHVHHHQITKLCAHEIKSFHSILSSNITKSYWWYHWVQSKRHRLCF